MHGKSRTALALAVCLAATMVVADVPSRPPTPQEKAALEKAVTAFNKIVDSIGSGDWKKKAEFAKDDYNVSKEPSSPIDSAVDFERSYEIPETSPLFKEKLMPIYMEAEKYAKKGDFAGAQKATDAVKGTTSFTVDTHLNRINIPAGGTKIDAKGAALAFSTAPDKHPWEVYVAVGNWSNAKPGPLHLLDFHFAHPRGTPYVENIVFQFKTEKSTGFAADRIREIVRKTDWGELNKGLTR